MIIGSVLYRFKWISNYFKILKSHIQLFPKIKADKNPKKVYFDLSTKNVERYYFALIFFFYEGGYTIYLKNNFSFISNCMGDGKYIFKIPNLHLVNNINPNPDFICISDNPLKESNKSGWNKIYYINFDIYSYKEKENHLWLPFPMSPSNYQVKIADQILGLRLKKRRIGVFFSGNTNKEDYTNPVIKSFFKKENRYSIIEYLKNQLPDNELVVSKNIQGSANDLNLNRKFVLIDWQWSPSNSANLDARVNNENWLESLSESNFFLAPPGVTMPLCHNIVEAMIVGTIPITEYPEYFNPPLIHNKTCLVYNGKEDLIIKIKEALAINEQAILELRKNVIAYFEDHLSSKSFIKKVETIESRTNVIFMNGENVSYIHHKKNN